MKHRRGWDTFPPQLGHLYVGLLQEQPSWSARGARGLLRWPPDPQIAALSVLGDSLWNIIVQEGHEMSHRLSRASSVRFWALGERERGSRSVCVDVCAGRGVSEDTSSDAAVRGYF